MSYKIGDIVLIKFPFTDLSQSKKRPVLVIKDENDLHDIVCFQITSNRDSKNILKINHNNLINSKLTLQSFIKYDKCFTLNSNIIDKKIAAVTPELLMNIKTLFCKEIF